MAGIELVEDQKTKKPASKRTIAAVQEAVKRGVIVNPGGTFENVLRLSPPLVITEEQLDRGIDILAESIKTVERS
jgi:4-aminobutyrate aminotransferase/(S)-3-amino-2-methylpropionate transaminase